MNLYSKYILAASYYKQTNTTTVLHASFFVSAKIDKPIINKWMFNKKRNAFQFETEMNEQTLKKILSSKQKILDHKNHQVYSPNEKKCNWCEQKKKKRCTVHKYKLFL